METMTASGMSNSYRLTWWTAVGADLQPLSSKHVLIF